MSDDIMYKLYAIDKYAGKTKLFIDSKYEQYTLDDLAEELENDKGYHMRICSDKSYIFFSLTFFSYVVYIIKI